MYFTIPLLGIISPYIGRSLSWIIWVGLKQFHDHTKAEKKDKRISGEMKDGTEDEKE
jgi:hypothetical protein